MIGKKLGLVRLPQVNSLEKIGKQLQERGFILPNLSLLFISDKDPSNISLGASISISISIYDGQIEFRSNEGDDPSTIFLRLPINKLKENDCSESIGYYPSYAGLTGEQRWIYLNWLQDVTKDIDIGYVFIYYYGLERHLLTGKFDMAFDEILKLRRYHRNKSFLAYSESSLVNSALLMKRTEKFAELLKNNVISNFSSSLFLVAYNGEYNLSPGNLMLIFNRMGELNKRYLKEDSQRFQEFLSQVLNERFGIDSFPFAKNYDISETARARYPLFANISLPTDLRTPDLPNFYTHKRLRNDIHEIFSLTHQKFKSWKADSTK